MVLRWHTVVPDCMSFHWCVFNSVLNLTIESEKMFKNDRPE